MNTLYQSLVSVEPFTLVVTILNLFLQLFLIKKFLPDMLPEVTTQDNGKFLCVENGAWVAKHMSSWSGGSY